MSYDLTSVILNGDSLDYQWVVSIKHYIEKASLIYTDPVYENVADYTATAYIYSTIVGNIPFLMFTSKKSLPAIVSQSPLKYIHYFDYIVKAKPSKLRGYNMFTWSTPILWLQKDNVKMPYTGFTDVEIDTNAKPEGMYKWNKNIKVLKKYILPFTQEGDWVLDPFMGSASMGIACMELNRNYIGIEKDVDVYSMALERITEKSQLLSAFNTIKILTQ